MRERLKEIELQRKRFQGVFDRYGCKKAYKGFPGITVLLRNIKTMNDETLTDHLWFNRTKGFEALGTLYPGDVIVFNARVRSYVKGYVGRGEDDRSIDYKMSHPSKLSFLHQVERTEGFYTICIKCGYPNRGIGDRSDRCYRCGNVLSGEAPEIQVDGSPKIEQTKLGGFGPL
jgi:hypothetical protein